MRNLHVDRLRGFASLSVVLGHTPGYVAALIWLPHSWQIAITANAYHGVSLFFTISGFLITSKLLEASDARGRFSLWAFYAHRIARIAPCLALMVAAACAVALIGAERLAIDWSELPRRLFAIFTFSYNVQFLAPFHGSRLWDPLWSLSVEEMFYLGFPLMLMLTTRRRIALLAVLAALIVIGPLHRYATANPYPYLSNFDNIAFGVIAALLTWNAGERAKRAGPALRCIGVGVIAITYVCSTSVYGALVFGPSFMGLGAALYLAGSAHERGTFSTFVLERYGSLSYEVYLLHMFVLVGLQPFMLALNGGASWAITTSVAWFVVLTAGILGIGQIIATFYSEPANRMIRRLSLRSRRQQAAQLEQAGSAPRVTA